MWMVAVSGTKQYRFRLKRCSVDGVIVSEAGSASGGISSHDGSKNDTDSDYNTEPSLDHINNFFILQPKKVVALLYSRDSNCKAYNYHKVAGDNF